MKITIDKNKVIEVNQDNDLIVVFRMPKHLHNGFCFNPVQHNFDMIDWFKCMHPFSKDISYESFEKLVKETIKEKVYFEKERNYLILTRFGLTFTMENI